MHLFKAPREQRIHAAAKSGDVEAMNKLLLKATAEQWDFLSDGRTPLMVSASSGKEETAKLLLKAGAKVNQRTENGWTALMLVDHFAGVGKVLIDAGADVNLWEHKGGNTALLRAAKWNNVEMASLLITAGADMEIKNKNYHTALLVAVKEGKERIVSLLLDAGADKEACDVMNETALMLAINQGRSTIVELLIKAGADLYAQNKCGETPTMIAVGGRDNKRTLKLLVEAGGDKTVKDKSGDSALIWASRWWSNAEPTERLVAAGADLCAQNNEGDTALHVASFMGYDAVKVLVHAGADKDFPDKDGCTALVIAAKEGHNSIVEFLVSAKAMLNTQDKVGCTALMYAAMRRGGSVNVAALLNAGADHRIKDKDGATAMDKARDGEVEKLFSAHELAHMGSDQALPGPPPDVAEDVDANTAPVASTEEDIPKPAQDLSPNEKPSDFATRKVSQGEEGGYGTGASSWKSSTQPESPPLPHGMEFTDQHRATWMTELLHGNVRLQQVMRTVAAHDRTLQMLVSKEKECPSLFWFYPKKPELRRWLSNPAKCLFQDTLMMVVVCPVTLCVVECGPDGMGWEMTKPKEWVKKWGPAILFSIYVMQAAVVAGRVVGIPLPPVPGAADVKKALGLKGMLGGLFNRCADEANLCESLAAFQEVTIAELERTVETQVLVECFCGADKGKASVALPSDLPMRMVDEAYKAIHNFLAKMGPLEDQLRGRMERVRSPDGDIEWVSVQGKDAWMQKQAATNGVCTNEVCAGQSFSATLPSYSTPDPLTWLGERLTVAGVGPKLVQLCERVLVHEEGFCNEKRLARTPSGDFDRAYLTSVGISGKGLQLELLDLHRELREAIPPGSVASPAPSPLSREASARFTEEDRQLLQKLKLQQRASEPITMHTVERGNQLQYTASAFSQQAVQDQQQLARRIAKLEARQARTEGSVVEHIAYTSEQFEDVHGRVDQLAPLPGAANSRSFGGGKDKARK